MAHTIITYGNASLSPKTAEENARNIKVDAKLNERNLMIDMRISSTMPPTNLKEPHIN